ncbi:DUF2141 domain-containing protein [Aquimarina sp. ERC-38]|uniref:DUF2141 domain-containing protein n=1 Tax=Aquimarina sp. ERC-38 TaxID=2949996 RepID=UPI002245983C|nr:DUF2141 domain-containing protein [Aquimarina sp. ERC-38]UZO80330.1 DUF2141 domain-containing protein [Aquimarina sp. ERC-38]
MKKYLTTIFILLITTIMSSQNQNSRVEVTIENIKNDKGIILVGLYKDPAKFLKIPFKYEKIKAKKGSVNCTFMDVAPGEYAISLFHDENENGKLDTNFIGIPKEAYGVSNNAKNTFSAPEWKNAKFTVSDGKTVTHNIKL